jgi:Insertion element 4 transposase N-terminal
VWRRLTAGLHDLQLPAPTASALRQARQRLGTAPLRALFELLRGPAATSAGPAVRWRGLLLTVIDGTMLTMRTRRPTAADTSPSGVTTAAPAIRRCG